MMYRCERCGETFNESEVVVEKWREYRGEYFGFPAIETVSEEHCPYCNSEDIEEYYEEDEDDL